MGKLYGQARHPNVVRTWKVERTKAGYSLKPAKLDNGAKVLVPKFIKAGDVIRLDPQTTKYMERAKAKHA